MNHKKYSTVKSLIELRKPVLLKGEAGTGKTTLFKNIAIDLDMDFYPVSMTQQTTLSHILGFITINGKYISTSFRKAVEKGGLFLMDEIDASNPNVILSLNTLQNGFIAFPDATVEVHKDFVLCATANPFDELRRYSGRSSLDESTLDRFYIIDVNLDEKLEKSILKNSYSIVKNIRKEFKANGITKTLSMREAIKMDEIHSLPYFKDYVKEFISNPAIFNKIFKDFKKILLKGNTISELYTNFTDAKEVLKNDR